MFCIVAPENIPSIRVADKLDFRRFQIDLTETIDMDDTSKIPQLTAYGIKLGRKILSDNLDPVQKMLPRRIAAIKNGD